MIEFFHMNKESNKLLFEGKKIITNFNLLLHFQLTQVQEALDFGVLVTQTNFYFSGFWVLLCLPNMVPTTMRKVVLSLRNKNISIHRLSFYSLSAIIEKHIKTLCHIKRLQEALNTFKHLLSHKSTPIPSLITYNLLLSSLVRQNQYKYALSIYKIMIETNIIPDLITLNIIIICHYQIGRLDYALKVFEGMEEHGYLPNVVSFTTLIKGHCKKFRVEDAIKVFNQQRMKQQAPSIVTYNTLIDGLYKA